MLYGVKFYSDTEYPGFGTNPFDTFVSLGFFLLDDVDISQPIRKTNIVSVPGTDGVLDFSDALGEPCYENRKITFTLCSREKNVSAFEFDRSRLTAKLNGKKLRVVLPMDYTVQGNFDFETGEPIDTPYWQPSFLENRYWLGVVTVGSVDYCSKKVKISVDAFPYKIDWKDQSHTFTIDDTGEREFNLVGSQKMTVPEFTFSDEATIYFTPDGETQPIMIVASAGTYKFPDIKLSRVNDPTQYMDEQMSTGLRPRHVGRTGPDVRDHFRIVAEEGTEISYRFRRMWL